MKKISKFVSKFVSNVIDENISKKNINRLNEKKKKKEKERARASASAKTSEAVGFGCAMSTTTKTKGRLLFGNLLDHDLTVWKKIKFVSIVSFPKHFSSRLLAVTSF